jgi:cytochrome c-type biogenesis protein CcmH/NrfG
MKKHVIWVALFAAFLVLPRTVRAQGALDDAQKSISARHYDDAISTLGNYLASNPGSAAAELLLAHAYHWKKDFPNAESHYRKAAALDPRYRLEIVALLDELGESEEIIRIAGPEVTSSNRLAPSILGALMTAYYRVGRPVDGGKIRDLLEATTYSDQSDVDYRNYMLAYCAMMDGDSQRAKDLLRSIHDRSYLQYAATDDKFKVLFKDPEFIEITK